MAPLMSFAVSKVEGGGGAGSSQTLKCSVKKFGTREEKKALYLSTSKRDTTTEQT